MYCVGLIMIPFSGSSNPANFHETVFFDIYHGVDPFQTTGTCGDFHISTSQKSHAPTSRPGQPCRPRDRQAFAKVLGGYHRLKEGSTAWALGQMTGDQPRSSRLANGRVGGDDEGDGLWIYDIWYIYIWYLRLSHGFSIVGYSWGLV